MGDMDWVMEYLEGVKEACGGEELRANCPFCGDDHKGHLYISTIKPVANCYRCGWRGTHLILAMELGGAESLAEAWRIIHRGPRMRDFQAIANQLTPRVRPVKDLTHMPDWFQPFSKGLDSLAAKFVLDYALRRLTQDELVHYGIGYCRDSQQPEFMRMVIPIERGYYQARAISPDAPRKYINPAIEVGDRLFNAQALDGYNQVFIAEGSISAIALGRNAVATLGKEANPAQLVRLGSAGVARYTIAYDAGTQYSRGVDKLAYHLARAAGKPVIIRQYDEGDPDSSEAYREFSYTLGYSVESRMRRQHAPKGRQPILAQFQERLDILRASS